MTEDLSALQSRFEELTQRLCDPAVLADPALYQKTLKDANGIKPLADAAAALQRAKEKAADATALLGDPELSALAAEELEAAKKDIERLTQTIKELMLPRDPMDDKDIIVEIRAGAGGEESALFAASLFRMYSMFAEKCGFSTEKMSENATELGGCREVCFSVSGQGAYSRFKFESGVHRVQRVPETETGGRIHTSTVTVAVLPQMDEVEVEIRPQDLKIDTYRASGAGGQHINKTDSAIRITHLPTGMVVECQDERSQFKNKDKALRVLRARLFEREKTARDAAYAADRKAQVGTGDRSERIRTYNFPQGRVTDHRIGLTIYRLEAFLDGDMDEVIEALIYADKEAYLKEVQE